jgi:DNA-directed RNA polymerase subunit RPC12/RpoP
MTSPPREVEVQCPNCGTRFSDWVRDSINLTLGEEWSEEEIIEATTFRCPKCDWQGGMDSLIVLSQ